MEIVLGTVTWVECASRSVKPKNHHTRAYIKGIYKRYVNYAKLHPPMLHTMLVRDLPTSYSLG